MPDAADATGTAPMFEFEGKKYRVAEFTIELEALCETHMVQNVIDGIMRMQATTPALLVDRMLYNLELLMAGRELAWGSDASNAYFFGKDPGVKYKAQLRLQKHNPSVTPELIDRIVKNSFSWRLLHTIFRWLDDPNRSGAVPTEPVPAPSAT